METSLRCVWQEAPHPWWSGITSCKTVRHRTAETNSCVVVCVQDKWDQACDVCRSLCGWGMSGYSCSLLAENLFSRGTAFSRLMFFTWAEFSLNLFLCRAAPEVTLMLQEHASHCAPWSILPAAGQRWGVTPPSLQSHSSVDADMANKAGLRSLTFCCDKATGQEKNPSISMLKCFRLLQMGQKRPEILGKALSLQWDVGWEFSGWGDISTPNFPLLKDVSLWKDSKHCEDRIHFVSNYSLVLFIKRRKNMKFSWK